KTRAPGFPVARLLQPEEGLHGSFQLVVWYSRTVVENRNDNPAISPFDAQFSLSSIFQCVVDQIGQDAAQRMRFCRCCSPNDTQNGNRLSGVLIIVGNAIDKRG